MMEVLQAEGTVGERPGVGPARLEPAALRAQERGYSCRPSIQFAPGLVEPAAELGVGEWGMGVRGWRGAELV